MNKIYLFIYLNSKKFSHEIIDFIVTVQKIALQKDKRITLLLIGSDIQDNVKKIINYNFDEIIVADDEIFRNYYFEIFIIQLKNMINDLSNVDAIFFQNDVIGKELAAGLSVDLNINLVEGAFDVNISENNIICKKYIYSNRYELTVSCEEKPLIITLHSLVRKELIIPIRKECVLINSEIFVSKDNLYSRIQKEDTTHLSRLNDVSKVISIGMGITKPGNILETNPIEKGLQLAFHLSFLLNGEVGASRAIVDQGIIDYEHQVGLSGKIITPDLYIACGISGSIQHLVGMMKSNIIVSINIDPHAPIFLYSHYGIVGNLFEILPALIEVFERRLSIKELIDNE